MDDSNTKTAEKGYDSKDSHNESLDEMLSDYQPGIMASPSKASKNTFSGVSGFQTNNLDQKIRELLQKMDDFLVKIQGPLLKKTIVWSYLSVIVFAILNSGLSSGLEFGWKYVGGPAFIFSMVTVIGSITTLSWYIRNRSPPPDYPNLPYMLSLLAWSRKYGAVEYMVYLIVFLGWIGIGMREIMIPSRLEEEGITHKKGIAICMVITHTFLMSSMFPIIGLKLMELNRMLNHISQKNKDESE